MTAQIIDFPANARQLHRGMIVSAETSLAPIIDLPAISRRYDGVRVGWEPAPIEHATAGGA